MREVKFLRSLPWVVLLLLWAAGTTLWLLFVQEQQTHTKIEFQTQIERLADELLRSRLEGRLAAPDQLPEGIRTFAMYDPNGLLVQGWGQDIPDSVEPSPEPWRTYASTNTPGWIGFLKALQPLRPRAGFLDDDFPGRGHAGPGMMMGRGDPKSGQGFTFLRVTDAPLQGRLWIWTLGGGLGAAAWIGFVAFVGVLWFRARRYQAALVQHREVLQFAEASRTLSHELQNPLAAILLQTALLKRAAGGEPAAEVSVIEEEALRMSALVARVRDFLKDPAGQAERVNLVDLASTLQGRFAVEVGLTIEGGAPMTVLFDPHRLRSVVENLLKNAVESGPNPKPNLRLSRPKPGWLRLEVTDSGSGFTADSLKNALNPFFTTKTTGTGIGLSIADGFVRAAGGRLKLENRQEGGARVTLDLPEAPAEVPA